MTVIKIILIVLGYLAVAAVLGFSIFFAYPEFKKDWTGLSKEQSRSKKITFFVTIALVVVLAFVGITTGITYSKFYHYDAYFNTDKVSTYQNANGENVKAIQYFKDYCGSLEGTIAGETEIYIMAGANVQFDTNGKIINPDQYASVLIMGGTHPNEPSGQLTATVFLENIKEVGDNTIVFILTETNKSGYSHSHPQEGSPFYYSLTTESGKTRQFKFGSRATNLVDQWPNPDVYTTLAGTKLSTNDARNLNRSYPGNPNGTYTEQIAYAVAELIRQNDIKMEIDLHEASPEYLTINAIIYHERAADIASNASAFNLVDYGITISAEPSSKTLRGLTHRELGDNTDVIALLCETSNSSQGKIRGKFTEELILDGMVDKFYQKAVEITANGTQIIYGNPCSMGERVGRHTQSILEIVNCYNELIDDPTGFAEQNTEANPTRQQKLHECGKIEFTLDLTANIQDAELKTKVNTLQNGYGKEKGAYGALLKYGVGIFLADPIE